MTILVIGATGLVGSHVFIEAELRGHAVIGTYRNQKSARYSRLNLADMEAARALLQASRPDWVVHAAGWTWVDGCERDRARAMEENANQPGWLAGECARIGARLAYISTTYIFDGSEGPYDEAAVPHPINTYAESKLAGENAVRAALAPDRVLIARVVCVWGKEALRKNFAYQVLDAVRNAKPMRIPSDQLGNPTWAGDIAGWLLQLMETASAGIWNLCGDQPDCSREEWVRAILRSLAERPDLSAAVDAWSYIPLSTAELGQPARRPRHSGAVIKKILGRFPRKVRAPGEIVDLIN